MPSTLSIKKERTLFILTLRAAFCVGFIFFAQTLFVHAQFSVNPENNTMVVEDAPEMEVIAYGKNVIVRKKAKGVLAIGGDIIIEGRVDGDVATVGGSVIQREGAFIGGDVFVLGGKYKPEGASPPLRNEDRETIMFAAYEEEFRHLSQNPAEIFAPSFSLTFFAQRALSVLFWFVVTLALTTIAPGAVSRGIARFNLSTLKIVGLGLAGLILTTISVIGSVALMPNFLSAILGLMAFSLLLLAYVFGRVTLQVSVGQFLQRTFLPERQRSETLAILIGVVVWTLLLSVPYLWSLAIVALFAAGIGLVLTSRSRGPWANS